MNIPATSEAPEATPKQIELLKEHGLWQDGLTKEEATKLIDKIVAEGGNAPPPGIHLFKFAKFEKAKDSNGNPRTDSRGYPGLVITFKCQHPTEKTKNEKGEDVPRLCKISDTFYYSTLPLDHPDRKDDDKRCKSEWKLMALKRACGWGQKEVTQQEYAVAKLWGLVYKAEHEDRDTGELITNDKGEVKYSLKLDSTYYPFSNDANHGKPALEGDPKNGPIGGKFLQRIKVTRRDEGSSSESSTSTPIPAPTEEASDATDF